MKLFKLLYIPTIAMVIGVVIDNRTGLFIGIAALAAFFIAVMAILIVEYRKFKKLEDDWNKSQEITSEKILNYYKSVAQ